MSLEAQRLWMQFVLAMTVLVPVGLIALNSGSVPPELATIAGSIVGFVFRGMVHTAYTAANGAAARLANGAR